MEYKKHDLGIDFLRGVAMLLVVCLHILGQGGTIEAAKIGSAKYFSLSLLQTLSYCAVNIYGIITGYLLCEKSFRLSRLMKIWLTVVFWSVAVSCLFFVVQPETRSISEMISMFLPILRGRYWFFTAYFVTYLVSPVLNHVIHTLPKMKFKLLLAALFVIFGLIPVGSLGYDVLSINSGHHFAWMMVLYLIGGYIKVYAVSGEGSIRKIGRAVWLGGYFAFAVLNLLFKIVVEAAETVVFGAAGHGDLFLTYSSPLIVGEAVCLFLFFQGAFGKANPNGFLARLIRFMAPGVFSVYIIHVHRLVFWNENIIGLFRAWDNWNMFAVLGAVLGTALVVFLVCVTLDALRQRLFRLLRIDQAAERLSDWIEKTVRKLVKA